MTSATAPVGPVIVALDGSELAARAMPVAAAIARARGVPLLVVRAVPRTVGSLFGVAAGGRSHARAAATEALRRSVAAVRAAYPDLDVSPVVMDGAPSRAILNVQHQKGASLLVLTSHGRTALARNFRGSVTEDVVRGAHHPVLVLWPWVLPDVATAETDAPTFRPAEAPGRRVLVPLDGSARTSAAIGEAFRFARAAGGSIVLATVLDVESMGDAAARALEHAVHRALSDRAAAIDRAGVPCTAEVVVASEPAEAIVGLATREGCDVIAMTTHARGAVGRFLLGGVASRVAAQAARPVILVPPDVGADPMDTADLPDAVRTLAHPPAKR